MIRITRTFPLLALALALALALGIAAPAGAAPPSRGAPNGAPAVDRAELLAGLVRPGRKNRRRFDLVTGYGGKAVIVGRLTTPEGQPIVGAVLGIFSQNHAIGARMIFRALPRTNAAGEFRWEVPTGASRDFFLHYRSHQFDVADAGYATARLRVRAGIRMWASQRRVREGQRVVFRGRLRGRPLTPTGKLVDLQARDRGAWRTFATVRADGRTGRFAKHYRFRRLGFSRTYSFRARMRFEASYPYLSGKSRTVRVRVRG